MDDESIWEDEDEFTADFLDQCDFLATQALSQAPPIEKANQKSPGIRNAGRQTLHTVGNFSSSKKVSFREPGFKNQHKITSDVSFNGNLHSKLAASNHQPQWATSNFGHQNTSRGRSLRIVEKDLPKNGEITSNSSEVADVKLELKRCQENLSRVRDDLLGKAGEASLLRSELEKKSKELEKEKLTRLQECRNLTKRYEAEEKKLNQKIKSLDSQVKFKTNEVFSLSEQMKALNNSRMESPNKRIKLDTTVSMMTRNECQTKGVTRSRVNKETQSTEVVGKSPLFRRSHHARCNLEKQLIKINQHYCSSNSLVSSIIILMEDTLKNVKNRGNFSRKLDDLSNIFKITAQLIESNKKKSVCLDKEEIENSVNLIISLLKRSSDFISLPLFESIIEVIYAFIANSKGVSSQRLLELVKLCVEKVRKERCDWIRHIIPLMVLVAKSEHSDIFYHEDVTLTDDIVLSLADSTVDRHICDCLINWFENLGSYQELQTIVLNKISISLYYILRDYGNRRVVLNEDISCIKPLIRKFVIINKEGFKDINSCVYNSVINTSINLKNQLQLTQADLNTLAIRHSAESLMDVG